MTSPSRPCPACGFVVFSRLYGSGESCRVCGWVDDLVQLSQPDLTVGLNHGVSLRQAQRAVLESFPATVRESGGAARDPVWRPLGRDEHPPAAAGSASSPVCYLSVPEPEEYEPYWLTSPRPPRPDD